MHITNDQFNSTTFILDHAYALNHHTVKNYGELVATNNSISSLVKGRQHDHYLKKWMQDNIFYEVRRFDGLHHPLYPDPDPLLELMPDREMSYVGFVMDPATASPMMGITDSKPLTKLYACKFGPGTPQSFMYEHVIIGWVMFYDVGPYVWVAEIQANNTLNGGVLNRPSCRRHFYRYLLSTAMVHFAKPCALIAARDMTSIHLIRRPGMTMPPEVPYHKDVVRWCGMNPGVVKDIPVTIDIPPDTRIWHTFPSA